jgi:hypothetical protein
VTERPPLVRTTLSPQRLLTAGFLLLGACGAHVAPLPPAATDVEPSWEDAFEHPPPVMLALRPWSLRRDPLYGPLLDKVLALARARSHVVTATRALDVVEDADEVIIGLRGDPAAVGDGDPGAEIVAAVLGVRADVDPAAIVDSNGHPLWSPTFGVRVPELVRERDENGEPVGASLFELPGRAWVMASGPARARLRESWIRPHPHPRSLALPDVEHAVVFAHVDGPFLVSRLRWLRPPAALAPVGRDLRAVEVTLAPGATEVRAAFSYADGAAASAAEKTLGDTIAAIAREKPEGLAWLGAAQARVAGPAASSVSLVLPLPPRLVDAFAGGSTHSGPGSADGGVPRTLDAGGAPSP